MSTTPPAIRAVCLLVAGMLLALSAGCGSITAQGRNASGTRLFEQGRYHEALQEFQEASYADNTNADALYNLAATYHRIGRVENRPEDLARAENYYNICLNCADAQQIPNHADCYRGLAVLLGEQGRCEEAMRLMQGWVDRQPRSADARIELARLYQEIGNRQAAQDRLTEALALDPNNTRALAAMGKIREEMGDPAQALANYQRSLAIDRFQPELTARVAALQRSVTPSAVQLPAGATPTLAPAPLAPVAAAPTPAPSPWAPGTPTPARTVTAPAPAYR